MRGSFIDYCRTLNYCCIVLTRWYINTQILLEYLFFKCLSELKLIIYYFIESLSQNYNIFLQGVHQRS